MAEQLKVRWTTPLMSMFRNFLLGRKHGPVNSNLRYAPVISARTQPPPILPEGEAHKLAANYYCLRDGRREVAPPLELVTNTKIKQLSAGSKSKDPKEVAVARKQPVTPGNYWHWD